VNPKGHRLSLKYRVKQLLNIFFVKLYVEEGYSSVYVEAHSAFARLVCEGVILEKLEKIVSNF
jgi:hypothetical protein